MPEGRQFRDPLLDAQLRVARQNVQLSSTLMENNDLKQLLRSFMEAHNQSLNTDEAADPATDGRCFCELCAKARAVLT